MNITTTSIFSSFLSSAVLSGAMAWLLKQWISKRLDKAIDFEYENRTRRLERLLKHYERQIEELYGPLWNAVHQLYVCYGIKEDISSMLDKENADNVKKYYHDKYFMPLHDEIRQIIKSKFYLLDGAKMPDGFEQYLRHSLQEYDQRELWERYGVSSSFLKGIPYPLEFHNDIENGFKLALKNYEECLEGLKKVPGDKSPAKIVAAQASRLEAPKRGDRR